MINDMFSLKDKEVVITGSGNGIGKTIYKYFKEMCSNVIGISKTKTDTVDIVCDVTDINKITQIINNIDRIDVLINCVGVANKDWNETINTNLTSIYNITKQVIEKMKKQKSGSIINITSINSMLAFPNNPQYVASKGGLMMLSKAFALDYGKYNIRVNNICPGYIKTKMTMGSYNNRKKEIENKTMLGRWGKPEDLIGACVYLASDASNYVTGIDLIVDGGWCAKGL